MWSEEKRNKPINTNVITKLNVIVISHDQQVRRSSFSFSQKCLPVFNKNQYEVTI